MVFHICEVLEMRAAEPEVVETAFAPSFLGKSQGYMHTAGGKAEGEDRRGGKIAGDVEEKLGREVG
jgi:hypothetical protein